MDRTKRRTLVITLIAGVPIAVLLVWPQAVGAQMAPVIAQAIAFRAVLALGFAVLVVIAVVIALASRRRGVLRSVAVGLAVVFGVTAAGNAAILAARGSDGGIRERDLVVAAWNTQGGAASPEAIARLVVATEADVVSLPETDADAAAEVARLVALEGRDMAAATTGSSIPTSVLISRDLGEYRIDADAGTTPGLPSAVWRPVDGSGPTIVAAHPMPPLPHSMPAWWAGTAWATAICDEPDVIVAGDLNATVDHLSGLLGGCRDAASEAGIAGVGTWPTTVPAWLGAPIDHVLAGSAWTISGARVITSFDDAGSDHRPIVATLSAR